MAKLERREAFKSLFSKFSSNNNKEIGGRVLISPPYYVSLDLFDKLCPECEGFCATSCQENIIKFTQDKIPYLDFSDSGCTFCEDCAKACPSEVLSLESGDKHIKAKTEISVLKCISWHNIMCFSCLDACYDKAIKFVGLFRPEVNENCTNCGFCLQRCPSNAIEITPIKGIV